MTFLWQEYKHSRGHVVVKDIQLDICMNLRSDRMLRGNWQRGLFRIDLLVDSDSKL